MHEQALASGTRRIVAVTGVPAQAAYEAGLSLLEQIEQAKQLDGEELCRTYENLTKSVDRLTLSQATKRVAKSQLGKLLARVKQLQKKVATSRKGVVLEQARTIANSSDEVVVAEIKHADKDSILVALDAVRAKRPSGAAMLFASDNTDNKVIIVAGVSKNLISKGLHAGDWVREAAKICGGGGGGRPDTAQAGGKNPDKIENAMEVATTFASEVLND